MASIVTKRVIVEAHEAEFNRNGKMTIGQQVDEYITDALKRGYNMQSVEVHIGDLEWEQMLSHFYKNGESVPVAEATIGHNRKPARTTQQ